MVAFEYFYDVKTDSAERAISGQILVHSPLEFDPTYRVPKVLACIVLSMTGLIETLYMYRP